MRDKRPRLPIQSTRWTAHRNQDVPSGIQTLRRSHRGGLLGVSGYHLSSGRRLRILPRTLYSAAGTRERMARHFPRYDTQTSAAEHVTVRHAQISGGQHAAKAQNSPQLTWSSRSLRSPSAPVYAIYSASNKQQVLPLLLASASEVSRIGEVF